MRYHVLAADYDGTVATHGQLPEATLAALRALRESGRKLVLVTGRRIDDLIQVCPSLEVFDRVVGENGAVLYTPATRELRSLAEAPPEAFAQALSARIGKPVDRGRVIVATWTPHEVAAVELIAEMGLELQVIFNKGAVMILPSGVNKALGLSAALDELGLSARNAVGVGDAENDHAFLSCCECAVAVANALEAVKQRADWVTPGPSSVGVRELAGQMLADDLARLEPRLERHRVVIGTRADDQPIALSPYQPPLLFAGSSGAGKSTLATALIEGLCERGYQVCVVDPEGDFGGLPHCAALGDADNPPGIEAVIDLLQNPQQNVALNLQGISLGERPAYFEALLPRLLELRARTGRPHWLVIDETHHVAPRKRHPTGLALPAAPRGLLFITVHPDQVSSALLGPVETAVGFGDKAFEVLREMAAALAVDSPSPLGPRTLESGQALFWKKGAPRPVLFRVAKPRSERRRHVRKYASGELGEDKSFFFRGPEQKLNLRASNLQTFLLLADGVDDDTWFFHLRARDYSRWFRNFIHDTDLAKEVAQIEGASLAPAESRARIRAAIEKRYITPS